MISTMQTQCPAIGRKVEQASVICGTCNQPHSLDDDGNCGLCRTRWTPPSREHQRANERQLLNAAIAVCFIVLLVLWAVCVLVTEK